ncbi:NADH-quinone oxidoreductase subunit I [Hafnia alvei]|uniref:NADH-quinone oxidoreductase subunit I n=1 Tax=Hafnia alvei TaxID=569 RepID=A0A377PLS8_HAFAL|nr:NADH-quinone oxidoreductase subunit I [Hafnia alvei]
MTLKELVVGFGTQVRSLWMIGLHAFAKRETQMYPEEPVYLPPRYRGRIVLTRDPDGEERCVACNLCAVACPVGCISLQKAETKDGRWYPEFFRINFSRCIFCGLCEEACPTTAIQLTPDFELGEFKRQDLVYEKEDLLISGPVNIRNITSIVWPVWLSTAKRKAKPKTKRSRLTLKVCYLKEPSMEFAFYIAALVARGGNDPSDLACQSGSRLAVFNCVFTGDCGGVLLSWRLLCGCLGDHRVCRCDYGSVRLRGHDA